MSASLQNKLALVTGGRQGIGRATVDAFARAGAEVLTCGRGPRPADLPSNVQWMTCDVAVASDVAALCQWVQDLLEQRNGADTGLDILVNNAGVQIEKTILDTSDADWDALMGVNAKGVFMVCRALIPVMSAGGSIINIASISATSADPGLALYNASKAFVLGLTRSIAVDHGPAVRCNAICPGWILTDMVEAAFAVAAQPAQAAADAITRHPAGRMGSADDIAAMAVWLGSDAAAFATGQFFTVDGGLTAASPLRPSLF